jgi:hypothetical protein
MRIDRLELFGSADCRSCSSSKRASGAATTARSCSSRVEGEGHEGWGEAVAEANPYYSGETVETVWHIVTEFLAPLVLGREFAHPREVFPALKRGARPQHGQGAARDGRLGSVREDPGAAAVGVLGGTRDRIASGVSIGIQDSLDQLAEKVETELRRRLPAHQDQDQARLGHRAPSRCSARASATSR